MSLPPVSTNQCPGFIVAPSQFHVKATIISCAVPEKRLEIQEAVQQKLLQNLRTSSRGQSATGCQDVGRANERPLRHTEGKKDIRAAMCFQALKHRFWPWSKATDLDPPMRPDRQHYINLYSDLEGVHGQAFLADFVEATGTAESPTRHLPELCSECIKKGTWCSGSAHLPGATASLNAAVMQTYPQMGIVWSACDSGIEAEVEHDSGRLLLQICPHLFFIPEADAKLFG